MLDESNRKHESDAKRFAEQDHDLCICCHAYGEDKRSLWVDCLYAVKEVVPDAIDINEVEPKPENHQRGFYLRICKACRGRFLGMMGDWWKDGVKRRELPKDHDGHDEYEDDPERNIPLRVNGAIVMLTREEWDQRETNRAPNAPHNRPDSRAGHSNHNGPSRLSGPS